MLPVRDGQRRVVVVVGAPSEIVAIEFVLLNAQNGRLVGIIAQTLGIEQDLVEQSALALARVNRQAAREQAQTAPVVDVGAVLTQVTLDIVETEARFKVLEDVVALVVEAARRADGFIRRGHRRLG